MKDISNKIISLRSAIAEGKVYCSQAAYDRIVTDTLPKGNLFDIAKAAGFLAAKKTFDLIPHCHPVSVDGLQIDFNVFNDEDKCGVMIKAEGKSVGRTGIEMEVMTAVSVAALTIYDLLKPLGSDTLEISELKLTQKKGGKSDRKHYPPRMLKAAVLVCSDSTAEGKREDKSGKIIQELLGQHNAEVLHYSVVPDDKETIKMQLMEWVRQDIPFIFTTGGTGLGPRDVTIEAVEEIMERSAPGITEAMRTHGSMRTQLAMMSRAVAGICGETLIVTLPGSSRGAQECLEAILPGVFHARLMVQGGGH